jgi:hypothetical protein
MVIKPIERLDYFDGVRRPADQATGSLNGIFRAIFTAASS